MDKIDSYRNRFYLLLESKSGEVKPFIVEQESFFSNVKNTLTTNPSNPLKRLDLMPDIIKSKVGHPHIRAFLMFLNDRKEPISNSFFSPEEIKLISDRVNYNFKKSSDCKKNKKCTMSLYSDTNWDKVVSGEEKVLNVGLAKAIGFTIGNATVTDEGNKYRLRDLYDFNNYKRNPQAYSFSNFSENAGNTILTALKKVFGGNFIQGLEELASFKHATGYKGFPIELEIPKYTKKS